MPVLIFGSSTYDQHHKVEAFPDILASRLGEDAQRLIYVDTPHGQLLNDLRMGVVTPDTAKFKGVEPEIISLLEMNHTYECSGGKGSNTAVASGVMGAQTHFYATLGTDPLSRKTIQHLRGAGVTVRPKIVEDKSMASAKVFIAPEGQFSIVYRGTNADADHRCVTKDMLTRRTVAVAQTSVPFEQTRQFMNRAHADVMRVIFNCTKVTDVERDDFKYVTDLVVNLREAKNIAKKFGLVGADSSDEALAYRLAEQLNVRCVITRGAEPVILAAQGYHTHFISVPEVEVQSVTGAGDAFLGCYAACLERGDNVVHAVRQAVVMGALTAAHPDASNPHINPDEVLQRAMSIRVSSTNMHQASHMTHTQSTKLG